MKTFQYYIIACWIGISILCLSACNKEGSVEMTTGKGGSFARFAILGDYLYAVNYSDLNIYNISNAAAPIFEHKVTVAQAGETIETIFGYKQHLFIGSTQGMHIFDINNPTQPQNSSTFEHAQSCDPVVVNDTLAFITLRGGNECTSVYVESGLYVVDIRNLQETKLISHLALSSPYGLGYDEEVLFVCGGDNGLYIFDYTNPKELQQIAHLEGFNAYDVIPDNGILLVVGSDEFRQYDYTDLSNIRLLSVLKYEK